MRKGIFVVAIIFIMSVPLFAGVSLDLGVSAAGNTGDALSRPLGGEVSIGMTLYNYKALIQITGGIFSPSLSGDSSDPVGILSAGILITPIKYLYFGFRSGMIIPTDDNTNVINYGGMVIRVQAPGKGLHFYGETEISFTGIFNRFSMGINYTL